MPTESPSPVEILTAVADDGASLAFCRHGGHLLRCTTASGRPLLYLSEAAVLDGITAIRGGVPIIFPQFADRGSLPKHGFARTLPWTLIHHGKDADGAAHAEMRLVDDERSRAVYPLPFEAVATMRAHGERLEQALAIRNTGGEPMRFTVALHTYLHVDALESVRVLGLEDRAYLDSAAGGVPRSGSPDALSFHAEVDRIYPSRDALVLDDAHASIRLESEGFSDWVVWNPGEAKAQKLADVEPGGHRRFVCLETARITDEVRLAPGEAWRGRCVITRIR